MIAGPLSPNKQLIVDFLDLLDRDPRAAFLTYAAPQYRQHNQTIADGREAVIGFFEVMERGPGSYRLKHLLEDDGKVVCFAYLMTPAGTPACVLVDMFRIDDGLITEHWDVAQRVTDLPFNQVEPL